ncbi:putative lipid scramblase CLPTM1 [Atheta coriaria]|uniref:putative lipid scramblase CLPTM1 n=1 Tax=Dalotia coriaria TaxID=877792 RepID=UPI0031F42E16
MSETSNANGSTGEPAPAAAAADGQEVANSPNGQPAEPGLLNREPTRMESAMAMIKSLILRAIIIYFITSFFRKPAPPPTTGQGGQAIVTAARNMFDNGSLYSLHVYLSEHEKLSDFTKAERFWIEEGLMYGDWGSGPNGDGSYVFQKNIPVTKHMLNNGSLFLHTYVTKYGESPDPKSKNYGKKFISSSYKQLNRFKKLKSTGRKNLLTGESEGETADDGKILSHWHENITINLVTDQTNWQYGGVPAPLDEYIKFIENGEIYKPVVFVNDYWNMAKDYKPLNETFSLHITFHPLSLFKWQLYAAQKIRQQWNWFQDDVEQTDDEQDTLKETLLETNPYLLGITIFVSILHSIFELLAFKNDIQFWNNRNSLEGLSVRSVFFGVFQSVVVLLYVLDNDTNTMVRISCFIGLGIELWKIQKVVDVKFENNWITFKDKGSYVESSTRQYDELAFKYLSWLCFPLLAGYSVYSLMYMEHKGWYSFVLNLLYGFLLTFGFIMMTPQLFINYKLKSVAHLPWRMLTYKFLNTFIDDMFAFVIKMPTMYRLGCFRDDIIFLIFLYQKWIYPVDKTRRNEFGYVESEANPKEETKAVEDKKTK